MFCFWTLFDTFAFSRKPDSLKKRNVQPIRSKQLHVVIMPLIIKQSPCLIKCPKPITIQLFSLYVIRLVNRYTKTEKSMQENILLLFLLCKYFLTYTNIRFILKIPIKLWPWLPDLIWWRSIFACWIFCRSTVSWLFREWFSLVWVSLILRGGKRGIWWWVWIAW